jgi:hypothetical protein
MYYNKSLSNTLHALDCFRMFQDQLRSLHPATAIPPDETFPAPISSSDSAHHFDRSFECTELCAAVNPFQITILLAEKNCFQEGTMGLAPESGGNQQTL